MGPKSLRLRLIGASLAWITISLLATGVLLVVLFRAHIARHFDRSLQDHLEELAAAAEAAPGGELRLTWEPADPRFKAPYSGWYWEVRAGGRTLKRSPSLLQHSLAATAMGPGQPHVFVHVDGPEAIPLRVIAQDIVLPDMDRPLTVLVAGPCLNVQRDVMTFARQLALSLGALGVTLAALILVQVGYGLRPLRLASQALAEVRAGRRLRLDARVPAEVEPLIAELNGLLDQREAMVERARAEAGDLAHALKTPIAVIRNEAHELSGDRGAALKAEADKMSRVVETHLVRARAEAGRRLPGGRASLDQALEDVRFTLSRLYPAQALQVEAPPGLLFAGEEDDLGEMIGNLADNAGKWARGSVRIRARGAEGRLKVQVEDDGPGLGEDQQRAALVRGERLDAGAPGFGLGLSIVSELAGLYGGELRLARSSLGGLSAEIELPAASVGR